MAKNLKLNLQNNFIISLFALFLLSLIFICFYLLQFSPKTILSIIYSLIGLLFILTCGLLIKYFNLSYLTLEKTEAIKNIDHYNKENHIKLSFKLFVLQGKTFLLSNWLWYNILTQSKSDSRFYNLLPNLSLDNLPVEIINIFINWIIFTGLLLIIFIFKNYFKMNNVRFARCLIYNPNNYLKQILYNLLLNIEFCLRFLAVTVLFAVILVGLFEYFAKKYLLHSFLQHSILISFFNTLIFLYLRKYLIKIINFLCQRQIVDLANILIIMFLISGSLMFALNQIFIKYLYYINILPVASVVDYNNHIFNFFNNVLNNTTHMQILFMGLNFILIFNAVNELVAEKFYFCKISNVYFMSLVFPMCFSFLIYNCQLNQLLQSLFNQELSTIIVLFLVIYMFNVDYKKIHHLLCFFNLNILKNDMQEKLKITYNILITKIVTGFWIALVFYYNFIYIAIESVLTIGIFLGLLIMIALISKIFWSLKRYELAKDFILIEENNNKNL